tara:strand:+ start:494 stop:715 length:222 start_codon:yes stop_codon:yes gene_type:complete
MLTLIPPSVKKTSENKIKWDVSALLVGLVNSPTLKNPKNANKNAALNKEVSYTELQIEGNILTSLPNNLYVIG